MITKVDMTDKSCECCGFIDAVEIEDESKDKICLCAWCALKATSGLLEAEDNKAVCEECGSAKTKAIKCFDRRDGSIRRFCLKCANKIIDEGRKEQLRND